MPWQPTIYSLAVAVAGLATAVVCAMAWRHRSRPLAVAFVWLTASMTFWSAGYAIQLGFDTVAAQLFWQRIGDSLGRYPVPGLWLLMAIYYSGRGEYVTKRFLALLAIEPLAMITLTWTDYHSLIWTTTGMTTPPGPVVVDLAFGPAKFFHVAYAYVLVILGVLLILDVFRRPSPLYHKQTSVLALGAMIPLVANAAFTVGLSPIPHLDMTPFSFAATGVLFGLALFQFDLLNLFPVARQSMLQELDAGIVVLDDEDRVVEYNAAAARILDPEPVVGKSPDRSFPEAVDRLDGTVLEVAVEGSIRFYDTRVSAIHDHRGRYVGRFVGLVDVTGLREREQRLTVANRLLRHNLRNSVSVIDGYAEHLEETVDGRAEEDAGIVREEAMRLARLGEKAREMVRTLDHDLRDKTPVEAARAVERAVERVQDDHPRAVVELELPPEAWIRAGDGRSVEVAVENLVENAIRHNDDPDPWVRVSVSTGEANAATGPAGQPVADGVAPEEAAADGAVTDGSGAPTMATTGDDEDGPQVVTSGGITPEESVRIRVEDDGPGIPEDEREVLGRGSETPLEHGSGLGLWIVNWVVRTSGGDIEIEGREPNGTVVTVSFPEGESPDPE